MSGSNFASVDPDREGLKGGSVVGGPSRRWRRRVLLFTVAVVSLPIILATVRHAGSLEHAVGDQAILQLHAEDIGERVPLVGVYSRLGFHHPGPMLYFVAAPAVRLFGSFGLVLTAAAVAIASVAGLLIVFHRRGGQVLFLLGAAFLMVLIRSMGLDLLSMWNPYVLVLPFALAIGLAWSVWCRDWVALPWLALVGSFVVQAHLGLTPAGGFLLVSAAVWSVLVMVRARRGPGAEQVVHLAERAADPVTSGRPGPGVICASIGVMLAAWFLPVLDQLTGDPGNVTRILESASSTANGERLGVPRALGLLGLLLGRVDPVRFNDTSDLRILGSLTDGSAWWLVVPVGALLVSGILARRMRLGDQLRLTGLLSGVLLTTIVAMASITGLPFLYLERWVVVLNAFIWLHLVWTILCAVVPHLDRRLLVTSDPVGRRRSLLRIGTIGLAVAIVGLIGLPTTPGSANDIAGSAAVGRLLGPVSRAIEDCGLVGVAPTGDPEGLLVASGLLVQLRRGGHDVAVDDLFAFSHGEEHSLRGRTPSCMVLVGPVGPDPMGEEPGTLVAPPAEPGGIGAWLVR